MNAAIEDNRIQDPSPLTLQYLEISKGDWEEIIGMLGKKQTTKQNKTVVCKVLKPQGRKYVKEEVINCGKCCLVSKMVS